MDLQEALEKYQGSKIEPEQLIKYQQWAFSFFHNEELVKEPNLSMTLQLDLTEARGVYEKLFKDTKSAFFQAYLIWNLVKALSLEWTFSTRKINEEWYLFKNLPVYFPIAVGGENRFLDVIINDPISMDWITFSQVYRDSIDNAEKDVGSLPLLTWSIAHFIGNLPDLNFTSFQIHRGILQAGRPVFYFGQRQNFQQRLTVPLSITFDHANADPYVLSKLMRTYQKLLTDKLECDEPL